MNKYKNIGSMNDISFIVYFLNLVFDPYRSIKCNLGKDLAQSFMLIAHAFQAGEAERPKFRIVKN